MSIIALTVFFSSFNICFYFKTKITSKLLFCRCRFGHPPIFVFLHEKELCNPKNGVHMNNEIKKHGADLESYRELCGQLHGLIYVAVFFSHYFKSRERKKNTRMLTYTKIPMDRDGQNRFLARSKMHDHLIVFELTFVSFTM